MREEHGTDPWGRHDPYRCDVCREDRMEAARRRGRTAGREAAREALAAVLADSSRRRRDTAGEETT